MFNVDEAEGESERKVFINHLSTLSPSLLEPALSLALSFIWTNITCSVIRVELTHIKEEGTSKVKMDPHIKSVFANCGFRWKALSNDPVTGKRTQLMQISRP